MFRYYSYYSVGGYKDMYFGNSTMNQEATYFLPLLGIQRKRAENSGDPAEMEAVLRNEALPKIQHVTQSNTCEMPPKTSRLISHGGYKLLFLHDSEGKGILILRDIIGDNKDESGRAVPFLIMITANTQDEIGALRHIAVYWSNHIVEVSNKIAKFITYDSSTNGIRFDLHNFSEWLLSTNKDSSKIKTIKGNVKIGDTDDFLLLTKGLSSSTIKGELGLSKTNLKIIHTDIVLPLDNPAKVKSMIDKAGSKARLLRNRKIIYYAIGGAIAIGLIVYVISTKHCD